MKYTTCSLVAMAIIATVLSSCSPGPMPIDYGADQCHHCKMIISDERFGAELVTLKGKAYKFDAIECLVPVLLEHGSDQFCHVLVTDFEQPGTFVNAVEASFLISDQLPSPMGGYLSAYASEDRATIAQRSHKGLTYDWSGLITEYQ